MSDRLSVAMGKYSYLAQCLALFLAMFAASIGRAHEGHPAIPTTGAAVHGDELLLSEGARQAIGLTTAKVTLADMPTYVRANGSLIVPWRQQCYVTTLMSGVVDDVLVRPGDEVEQGQVLARISSLPLEQIQLDLLRAHADYHHFSELHARREALSRSGAGFDAEFLEATYKREEAASRWQLAATKLKALSFDDDSLARICSTAETVEQIEIRSPMQGAVVSASIRGGQTVDRESQLFHIVDNSIVWCVADVPETDSGSVKVDQPATVTVTSLADAPRVGRVDHIHLIVDPKQRVVPVVIELANEDLKLRPGMSARITLQVAQSEQAIVCPRESLVRSGEDRFVLVKRGPGKFIRRRVQPGRMGTAQVEILDGVFPGDQVAASGAHLLGSLFQHLTETDLTETATAHATPHREPLPRAADEARPPLEATGVVELPPSNKVFATSRVGGRIKRIFVEHCQRVTKGDPLAEIESVELFDLQLELVERYLKLRWTERHLAQLEKLSAARTIPQMNIRKLENDLRKLKHEVVTLTHRLVTYGLAEEQVSRLLAADATDTDIASLVSTTVTIRAPHDGRVTHFDLSPGRIVDANDHELFEIHDSAQFWIKAYLLGDRARAIALGQSADVRFAADDSLRASGRVVRIAPTSAESQRVFPVWIELDQTPGSLREGMLARLQIHPVPVPSESVPRMAAAPDQKGD